jgi:diaminopimelate decarboxylase
MNFFAYRNNELYCEDVPIREIAGALGTPVYVYSHKTLERHFRVFDGAFKGVKHLTCYSCKANSNVAVLRLMVSLGGGVDIVSGGELYRALQARVPANKIVFSGVGKTEDEIGAAMRGNILMLNVESAGELSAVRGVAKGMRKRVPLSIRVNPQIDARTHPYITTGLEKNKFGVPWEHARELYREMRGEPYLDPVGISSHIGSQILELGPFVEAMRSLKGAVRGLKEDGIALRYVDIGGGLGITYRNELPPHPEDYGKVIREELHGMGLTVILEPGRVLVGNSGILVTKLLYLKKGPSKTFYIVDGAMNDLVRPAFYDAYHQIIPVREPKEAGHVKVDLVGPICESGDFFARDRDMPLVEQGEYLAILGAGAYGFSMSSNYNSRRRPAEVLVRGKEFFVIRKRETLKDLMRGESIPSFLEV